MDRAKELTPMPQNRLVTLNSILDDIAELARQRADAGDMTEAEARMIVQCMCDALRGFFPAL